MMNEPLVSVVIPTIPSRKLLLERALESVNTQTYKNIEIISVTEGGNACEARNIGISRSHGDFIAFLDDDDTWHPLKIEKQVEYMLRHPSVGVVICYSDDRRRQDGRVSRPPSVVTHQMLVKGFNLSSTSSYLVRRYALELVKQEHGCYFDEGLSSGHEYDLALRMTNLRLSQFHEIHCLSEILMVQFKTPGQISENWGKKIRGQYEMMERWGCEYSLVEYLKRVGLIGVFFMGFIFGDLVMYPVNFMKSVHEVKNV